jgi:hypothetical protein
LVHRFIYGAAFSFDFKNRIQLNPLSR